MAWNSLSWSRWQHLGKSVWMGLGPWWWKLRPLLTPYCYMPSGEKIKQNQVKFSSLRKIKALVRNELGGSWTSGTQREEKGLVDGGQGGWGAHDPPGWHHDDPCTVIIQETGDVWFQEMSDFNVNLFVLLCFAIIPFGSLVFVAFRGSWRRWGKACWWTKLGRKSTAASRGPQRAERRGQRKRECTPVGYPLKSWKRGISKNGRKGCHRHFVCNIGVTAEPRGWEP